ncbi:hypothetical protein CHH28_02165 [Bacterioplanes sanyensis]|uniref:Heparan-alpha-glucosaminide N-acetyltransferase catalytic domain-containing protein n=1 Tax=Bacterioplanes sanyensis TaxID=1249553 RepID=A0A222FFK7_9GAMM|nr:heparan-alpha-glucosaminide N-acetyltransferase domain-containing protein [Bacterioplanes sanyensis]ASP37550.1 hypothetical protein CHH28_02165 [Bacterioplanes sanyensis]
MNERIEAVDIGRGLAVMVMVCVHVMWMYASVDTQGSTWLGHLLHTLGKGTAAFLLFMGMSLQLARHKSTSEHLIRSVQLIALGYLMNALKFLLPLHAGVLPEAFIQAYGWQAPLSVGQQLYLLSTGDILQLAGLTLALYALLQCVITSALHWCVVGIVIALMTPWLRQWIDAEHYVLKLFAGHDYQVYFPMLPWASFIFFGAALGQWWRQSPQQCVRALPWIGGLSMALGFALYRYDAALHMGNFFHHGPGGTLYLLGITLLALWLIQCSVRWHYPDALMSAWRYCSQRVTSLYVIQWVLVCWGMGIVGFQTQGVAGTLLLIIPAWAATLAVQWLYDQQKERLWRWRTA